MEAPTKKLITIAACLNLGHILTGFGMAWSAPMSPALMDSERTPLSQAISEGQAWHVQSCLYYGTFAAFTVGFISNCIGRRYTSMIGGLVNLLAYLILTWPANLAMIYAGRVLVGFGLTFVAINNIVYIGEIAPPHLRGIMLTSTGVFQVLGGLLVVSLGPLVKYSQVGCIGIVVTLFHMVGSFYIPESPIYYAMKDQDDRARKVLQRIRHAKHVETELDQILLYVEEKKDTIKFSDVFTLKCNRKASMMGSILMKIQQMNGIAAVIIIATTIFGDSTSSTIIIYCISLCGTLVAPVFVERCGMKGLLIVSTGGCGISMTFLSVFYYLEKFQHPSVYSMKWLLFGSLIVALFTYNIGLHVVPNALAGEMFRPQIRATGTALILTQGWIFGYICAVSIHSIVERFGYHLFFVLFAIFNFLSVLIAVFTVPDTKGKSLAEIEKIMER